MAVRVSKGRRHPVYYEGKSCQDPEPEELVSEGQADDGHAQFGVIACPWSDQDVLFIQGR